MVAVATAEAPVPAAVKAFDELIDREQKERCPVCRTPFCAGELGRGTKIEVRCRRCKQPFQIVRL